MSTLTLEITDKDFQKNMISLYAISSPSPLFFSINVNPNHIPHFHPLLVSLSVQPPLETSLSSSLDGNGSPFPPPLSQPISRSCGGAAVCSYMWAESEREEDGSLDYMPTSLGDFHSTWPFWFRDWKQTQSPTQELGYPLEHSDKVKHSQHWWGCGPATGAHYITATLTES